MLQERTLSPPPLLAKSRHVVPTILRGHSGKFSNRLLSNIWNNEGFIRLFVCLFLSNL